METVVIDTITCVARLDRLPVTLLHNKIRWIIGSVIFFDAFDAMMVALTLPMLAHLWHLKIAEIGYLISIGYVGQAIGAIGAGHLAEKFGRIRILQFFILVFSLLSIASAFAQSYPEMLLFRLLAGLGLGGVMPIGAAYISEFSPKNGRGRFFLLYEVMFMFGFIGSSFVGALILPHFGWRAFYLVGGLPAFLVLAIRQYCPESARWLIMHGRAAEAEKIVEKMEIQAWTSKQNIPDLIIPESKITAISAQKGSFWEIFSKAYLKRTLVVWIVWIVTYSVAYGALGWIPSLLQHVYHVPLQKTLNIMFLNSLFQTACVVLSIFLIDKVGRYFWFKCVFFLALIEFALLAWIGSTSLEAFIVLGFSALGSVVTVGVILYLYTSEIYPTRIRAIGLGCSGFWMRTSSIVAPLIVGGLLPVFGMSGIFCFFAATVFVGLLALFFGNLLETSSRNLEEISH